MPPENRYVRIAGYTVRYWVAGSGPPVFLVHGLGASMAFWERNFDHLARHFQVWSADLPGFGLSEKPDGGLFLHVGVRLLLDLVDGGGIERASLVGNSMGGLLAMAFALQHPERVSNLVLVASAGLGREVGLTLRLASIPGLGELMARPLRSAIRWEFQGLFHNPRQLPERLVEETYQQRREPGAVACLLRTVRAGVNLWGQKDSIIHLRQLPNLRVPTLVVWGRQDRLIPFRHALVAQQLIPNARLAAIDRCGHCPQLERPDEFNRLVTEFLVSNP